MRKSLLISFRSHIFVLFIFVKMEDQLIYYYIFYFLWKFLTFIIYYVLWWIKVGNILNLNKMIDFFLNTLLWRQWRFSTINRIFRICSCLDDDLWLYKSVSKVITDERKVVFSKLSIVPNILSTSRQLHTLLSGNGYLKVIK